MHSGMGATAAKRAINWVLSKPLVGQMVYQPKIVIMAGFAGALIEGLQVGEVVLASEVGNQDGNFYPATWLDALPGSKWKTALNQCRIVTSNRMVCSSKEKKEMRRINNALAVDMESAHIAYACAEKEVPFGCIRAISDSVDTGISDNLAKAISGDRVSLMGLTGAIIRSPKTVLELVRLANNSRIAAQKLSAALCEMLRSAATQEDVRKTLS